MKSIYTTLMADFMGRIKEAASSDETKKILLALEPIGVAIIAIAADASHIDRRLERNETYAQDDKK